MFFNRNSNSDFSSVDIFVIFIEKKKIMKKLPIGFGFTYSQGFEPGDKFQIKLPPQNYIQSSTEKRKQKFIQRKKVRIVCVFFPQFNRQYFNVKLRMLCC